jgi:hypothetical protein
MCEKSRRVRGGVAHAVAVFDVLVDPGADGLDLVVAGERIADDLARLRLHLVGWAVAALQQVKQRVVGQRRDGRGRRAGRDADVLLRLHHHLDLDAHLALRDREALAQVAVAVDVFGGADPGRELVALADHPLRHAAARPEHGDHGAVLGRLDGHGAVGLELHGGGFVFVVMERRRACHAGMAPA